MNLQEKIFTSLYSKHVGNVVKMMQHETEVTRLAGMDNFVKDIVACYEAATSKPPGRVLIPKAINEAQNTLKELRNSGDIQKMLDELHAGLTRKYESASFVPKEGPLYTEELARDTKMARESWSKMADMVEKSIDRLNDQAREKEGGFLDRFFPKKKPVLNEYQKQVFRG